MGNVLSGESAAGILDADTIEDDLRWLTVQGSLIFNDDFLEEEYPNLPDYDGTEVNPEVPKGSTAGEHGSDPGGAFREISDGPDGTRNTDIIRRILQLLGPLASTYAAGSGEMGSGTRGTSVEDFPALLGENSLKASPQAIAARMRARLFQRMHLALLRQAYRAMSSQEASRGEVAGAVATATAAATAAALSAFAQPPPASSQEGLEEPTAIMTSASIRMSLNIMAALRGTCPGLFVTMSRTLMDIFTTSSPFSLGKITSPAYVETLSQLRTMAQGAAMADAGFSREERAEAMVLLLGLGIATGSMADVVCVAERLLEEDAPPLPSSSEVFLNRLGNLAIPAKTTIPRPFTWTASFVVRVETPAAVKGDPRGEQEGAGGAGSSAQQGGAKAVATATCASACNPATDGEYLYVWEAASKAIHKVGTGFHGTLAGNVYLCRKNMLNDIGEYKGMGRVPQGGEDGARGEGVPTASPQTLTASGRASVQGEAGGVAGSGSGGGVGSIPFLPRENDHISESSAFDGRARLGGDAPLQGQEPEMAATGTEHGGVRASRFPRSSNSSAFRNRPDVAAPPLTRFPPGSRLMTVAAAIDPGGVLTSQRTPSGTSFVTVDDDDDSDDGDDEDRDRYDGDGGPDIEQGGDVSDRYQDEMSQFELPEHGWAGPIFREPLGRRRARGAEGTADVQVPSGTAMRERSAVPEDVSRSDSPPRRTMDQFLQGALVTMRADDASPLGNRTPGTLGMATLPMARTIRPGLLRFRMLIKRPLLPEIPPTGYPEVVDVEAVDSLPVLEDGDEGEIWRHKVVHGFRWYKVRAISRQNTDQLLNHVGWVPLFGCDFSEWGSLNSAEITAEIGEEIMELVDPSTGSIVDPDTDQAMNPPAWEGVEDIGTTAEGGRNGDRRRSANPSSPGSEGEGRDGAAVSLQPVWLALVGGKLFLREKASGVLSSNEIAVLRPSDLSLESVLSLADLPIPGFPHTTPKASLAASTSGRGDGDVEAEPVIEGDRVTATDVGLAERTSPDEANGMVEFADLEGGAVVKECSSSLLPTEDSSRQYLLSQALQELVQVPSSSDGTEPTTPTAFAFADEDVNRTIVVDLGHTRCLRQAGVTLFPLLGVDIGDVVGSLLVEVSSDGNAWTMLGRWNASEDEEALGMDIAIHQESRFSLEVSVEADSEQVGRLVRYSLIPPVRPSEVSRSLPMYVSYGLSQSATRSGALPRFWLKSLSARGPGGSGPCTSGTGDPSKPPAFPAMATDSRHIILLHAVDESSGDAGETKGGEAPQETLGRLELYFLDPEDGYRLVRSVTLAWPVKEASLHKQGLLSDGDRLISFGSPEGHAQRTEDTSLVPMEFRCGPLEATDEHSRSSTGPQVHHEIMEFDVRQAGLAPQGVVYDRRNNVMWGWDPVLKKLCRWRCNGLSPIFASPRPIAPATIQDVEGGRLMAEAGEQSSAGTAAEMGAQDGKESANPLVPSSTAHVAWLRRMLTSHSAAHRVEALQELERNGLSGSDAPGSSFLTDSSGPAHHAALVLGYLERVGEPYGPPEEPAAESRSRCELEAASGGSEDGTFARLMVRGEDWSCREPGINVLVLSESLGAEEEPAKAFAVHESPHASDRLADYLCSVPEGRTVMIAVQDDAAGNLTKSAKRALLSVGVGDNELEALMLHRRASFALIGRKGAKPGSVPQALRLVKKGYATVRQRLPAPKVPLCVDVSQESLQNLVTLILRHEHLMVQRFNTRSNSDALVEAGGQETKSAEGHRVQNSVMQKSELQAGVVLSAVNILTNQVYQLLRGATPFQALGSFRSGQLARLLEVLLTVIDQGPSVKSETGQGGSDPVAGSPEGDGVEAAADVSELAPGSASASARRVVPSRQDEPTAMAAEPRGGEELMVKEGKRAVVRVSCVGNGGHAPLPSYGQASVRPAAAGGDESPGAMQDLLQEACLRLFVTGMDLFYPSCEERCNLLTLYLMKYLSDGLSPAREMVLELFLRRMSEPAQVVELICKAATQPEASSPGVTAGLGDGRPLDSSSVRSAAVEADPAGVLSDARRGARGLDTLAASSGWSGGASARETPDSGLAKAAPYAPHPIELQSLLLRVATAEAAIEIKAMGSRAQKKEGGAVQGNPGGRVGQAAVEMLGRLANQTLSGSACVIIESEIGVFDQDLEGLDAVIAELGMAPIPFPATSLAEPEGGVGAGPRPEPGMGSKILGGDGANEGKAREEAEKRSSLLRGVQSPAIILVLLVTSMCRSCAELVRQAVQTVDMLAKGQGSQVKGILPQEIDQLLQRSPVGALLPVLASALALLIEKHGRKLQGFLGIMAEEVVGIMRWVNELLERVPYERRVVTLSTRSAGTIRKTVVMESKHNYAPNTDEVMELHIPGANRMIITFDGRSSTEDGYDFVVFWRDSNRRESWHPHIQRFSGSGDTCNFPGFGGRPPLVIESGRAWVQWKTDQSNEDWGWKFTATADVGKPSSGGDGEGYWVLGLDKQLAAAGAALAGCLVISLPWGGESEDDNAPWMEDDLLAGAREVSPSAAAPAAADPSSSLSSTIPLVATGVVPAKGSSSASTSAVSSIPGTSTSTSTSSGPVAMLEKDQQHQRDLQQRSDGVGGLGRDDSTEDVCTRHLELLQEVVDRLDGTGGTKLCKAMRDKVGEDQGSVEAINRAVYATCAALIWHQGLGADALALVEGRASTPSKALTKAWRFGQQIRQYFDYGDVRDAIDSQMELQRQQAIAADPSLWKTSSANSLDESSQASKPIMIRRPSIYQGAEDKVITEVSKRIVSRALFLLSLPSQANRASIQENSKRRWTLLSKASTGLGRTPSQSYMADGAELLEKWKQVVDEATAMHKLKSILTYRRKAADLRERAKTESVCERIMKFVQSPADVAELELVRHTRDRRASLRREGLRLTRGLVAAAASPPSKTWLLASHAKYIRLTKRDDRPGAHVHYLSCVEGCAPDVHLALAREFALLVKCSLDILKECSRPKDGETRAEALERRTLAVSALQALALDYDVGDHDILKESILLEVLEPLLKGLDELEESGFVSAAPAAEAPRGSRAIGAAAAAAGGDGGRGTDAGKENAGEDEVTNDQEDGKDDHEDIGGADDMDNENDDGGEEEDWDKDGEKDDDEDGDAFDDAAFDEMLEEELEGKSALVLSRGYREEEEAVRRAAWCLFEVLLPRCVGLEGQGLETRLEEPTTFSHRLLDVLVRQVGRASANVQRSNTSLGTGNSLAEFVKQAHRSALRDLERERAMLGEKSTSDNVESSKTSGSSSDPEGQTKRIPLETPLLTHGMRLRSDQPGRAAPHRELGIKHTLCLWLRRDSCPLDTKAGSWYSPVQVGDTVARGPNWPLGHMLDGGLGGLGTVTDVTKSDMTVKVHWYNTGESATYKMGALVEAPAQGDDESTPASVEDLLIWEVVKADETLGGSVVMKGGWNNVSEDHRSLPWSQVGLYLQGNGTLVYYGTSGDHVFAVHSKNPVGADTWVHVAAVLDKSKCRIYIDGEESAVANVPRHMLNPGAGMVKGTVESQHPYPNDLDKLWEVNVDGAVSYTVSFDPLTKTEANHDFVRFVTDPDELDSNIFGEERYSGGRDRSPSNWPGLGGRPPLVIEAPRFFVYFYTDQSNFDWGFKFTYAAMVAAPDTSDEDEDEDDEISTSDLNPFPIYLGQPPGDVSSMKSASGFLWGASTYAGALTADQINRLARDDIPPEPVMMEEHACIDVLSLVQRCASSTDGAVSQAGGLSLEAGASPLVSPQVLGPLLIVLLQGSLKLQLAAGRLCEKLLPQAPLEMVQVQLSRVGLTSPSVPATLGPPDGSFASHGNHAASLVRALMLSLGETLAVWAKPAAMAVSRAKSAGKVRGGDGIDEARSPYLPGTVLKESRHTGEEALTLAGAHIGLLRALFTKQGWSVPLAECIREACSDLPRVVKQLEEAAELEVNEGNEVLVAKALCDPSLSMMHATLALLGGSFKGLHLGGRAIALLGEGESATVEKCTVLALEWPQPYLKKARESQGTATASKSTGDFVVKAKEWERLNTLGDAVVVCLHSEPNRPRVLPRTRVSPDDATPSAAFLSALEIPPISLQLPFAPGSMEDTQRQELLAGQESAQGYAAVPGIPEVDPPGHILTTQEGLMKTLVEAFGVLSSADASDKRDRYKPLIVESIEEQVIESAHPHERGVDETFPLDFPGADSIQLIFGDECRTEQGVAYIRIYKDEAQTAIWGENMYHGRDNDANWPGVDGRPTAFVPASSCVIKFHSEDRTPDWGFHITARARCRNRTDPPESPPLLGISALSTLQACGAKALLSLVTCWPQFLPHTLPLIKPLSCGALGHYNPEQDTRKKSPVVQRLVVETEHPYSHNSDRRESVKIEGARKLIITFDERTRTEPGCDYLTIFADETMSAVYGEQRYTGGKDGNPGNWPGLDGRPPLEIPAGHFFFRWTTDASVNDWGWKMIVTAVLGKIEPGDLPLPLLETKMAALLGVCRDCPKEQTPATGLEKFEKEPVVAPRRQSLDQMLGLSSGDASRHSTESKWESPPFDEEWKLVSSSGGAGITADGVRPPVWTLAAGTGVVQDSRRPSFVRYTSPRKFVVNARDAEEAPLQAEPRRNSREVRKLSLNMTIVAIGEDGDWLQVVPDAPSGPGTAPGNRGEGNWSSPTSFYGSVPGSEDSANPSNARASAQLMGSGCVAAGANNEASSSMTSAGVFLPFSGRNSKDGSSASQTSLHGFGQDARGNAEGNPEEQPALWALRRHGDKLYLVPEEEVFSHLVTLPDDGGPRQEGNRSSREGAGTRDSSTTVDPVVSQVVDPPMGDDAGPSSQGAFGLTAGEQVAADSDRLWSALAETSRATTSMFSHLALTRILAGRSEVGSTTTEANDLPRLNIETFGGDEMFLRLLRTTFAEERGTKDGEVNTAALKVFEKMIIDAAGGKIDESRRIVDILVAFALRQLRGAVILSEFLCETKAVLRTWETAHNYSNNTDSYSKVVIPGAKRIRIVFDEKSSTEMECDYVKIFKGTDRKAHWGEHKYHGPASHHNRVWAGVGGRPPLIVEADHFEVHFHSDSSNVDWGARLMAYGIMQEPTQEQRAALEEKRKELGTPETEMACWLLETLAQVADGDYAKGVLYRRDTLETMLRFLESGGIEGKIWVVHLLTAMLQDVMAAPPRFPVLGGSLPGKGETEASSKLISAMSPREVIAAGRLGVKLWHLTDKQAKLEESKGTASRSPLLQALAQACVMAEECLRSGDSSGHQGSSYTHESYMSGAGSPETSRSARWPAAASFPPSSFLEMSEDGKAISVGGDGVRGATVTVVASPGSRTESEGDQVMRWHMRVKSFMGEGEGPCVGVALFPASVQGWTAPEVLQHPSWLVTWSCRRIVSVTRKGVLLGSVMFGPNLRCGDVVTVEVDTRRKSVSFYRNQAFVGFALGPKGFGAALEHGHLTFPSQGNRNISEETIEGDWVDGTSIHAAVTLGESANAVELVAPPLSMTSQMLLGGSNTWPGEHGASSGSTGWFGLVKESVELMASITKRELPLSFVAKELLPKCQEHASVSRESSHPLSAQPFREDFTIPGASALEITFDKRTCIGAKDVIAIFGKENATDPVLTYVGLEGGTDSSTSSASSNGIAMGDRVVRGPSWDWGAGQDGGPGGFGTVVDIKTWKGKPRAGVKVRWDDTDYEGLYRWDYEGLLDLLVVGQGGRSTKPVVVPGDFISLHVDPDASSSESHKEGQVWEGALQLKDRAHVSISLPRGVEESCMSGEFTLECWFLLKGESDTFRGPTQTHPLFSRSIMKEINQIDISAVTSGENRGQAKLHLEMRAADQSVGLSLQGGALLPEKWAHVAFAIDVTGSATLMVDGDVVATGLFAGQRMVIEGCDLLLGSSLESAGACLVGNLYDFRLWCKARTARDVSSGRKTLPEEGASDLLANYPLNGSVDSPPTNRGRCKEIIAMLHELHDCSRDTSVDSPVVSSASKWGWACTITPIFDAKIVTAQPELREGALWELYQAGDARHDMALVRYVNSYAEKKGFDATRLLRCSWDDMVPSEEDLVREPLLRELFLWPSPAQTSVPMASDGSSSSSRGLDAWWYPLTEGFIRPGTEAKTDGGAEFKSPDLPNNATDMVDMGVEETKGEPVRPQGVAAERRSSRGAAGGGGRGDDAKGDKTMKGRGKSKSKSKSKGKCIAARFELLQLLNRKLRDALPFLDLHQVDRKWAAATLLSSCRGLIFEAVKKPALDGALSATAFREGGQFDLRLSRAKAARNIHAGHTDAEGRWSVFGQAFRQIHPMHPRILRTEGKLYNCFFMGERAQDAGGPYRESWSMYTQELQSSALPLLIRTPNAKHAAGMGRDNYVPNPGASSAAQVEMFVFLGKLMGHAIRSKEYLALNLSGVVWKALVGQETSREDLEGVDALLTRSMQHIRTIDQKGVTPSIFSDVVPENFTALSLDDTEVELRPGGHFTPVTWDNRFEYADLVESHRLAECCSMVKYIRKGLSMVVPMAELSLFTGDEVERMVCGKPEVDIDLLEAVTEYSGCRREQPHIRLFWQALREFTPEERSMLIKFTWGRTRLPLTAEGFSQRFKLQSFGRSPPDDYLPVAHTCFFSLELPAYSSLEVMKERLRNAIYNCQSIDGDDTFAGMQVAAMGWDWQEDED